MPLIYSILKYRLFVHLSLSHRLLHGKNLSLSLSCVYCYIHFAVIWGGKRPVQHCSPSQPIFTYRHTPTAWGCPPSCDQHLVMFNDFQHPPLWTESHHPHTNHSQWLGTPYVKLYTIDKVIGNLTCDTLVAFGAMNQGFYEQISPVMNVPRAGEIQLWNMNCTTPPYPWLRLLPIMTVATWITWKVSCQTGKLMSFKSGTSKPNDTRCDYRPAMYLVVGSVAEHWPH